MFRKAETGGRLNVAEGPFDAVAMKAWGAQRTIRAAMLRHLLVGKSKKLHVDPKGIHLRGVRIIGRLDLGAATLRCPLRLEKCYLASPQPVNLTYATVSFLALIGCYLPGLTADVLVVTKDLDLHGSTFTGPIRLLGAEVTGEFSCRGAHLTAVSRYGALVGDRMKVGGDVFLDGGFTAAGAVPLTGADITGGLSCGGATLKAADGKDDALNAEHMKVGGPVFLNPEFSAVGAVRLIGADITGQLNCQDATLKAADGKDDALNAGGMKVGGDVLLDRRFAVAGMVSLRSARIEGSLCLSPTKPAETEAEAKKRAETELKISVDATGAKIAHTLSWAPCGQVAGRVILKDVEADQLDDAWAWARSPASGYWPSGGLLRLDGFTYTRITGEQQANVRQRLAWIQSQYKNPVQPSERRDAELGGVPQSDRDLSTRTADPVLDGLQHRGDDVDATDLRGVAHASTSTRATFATQPYEQLANVYQQAGQDAEARQVAVARRRDLRKYGRLNKSQWVGNWLLDNTIRYGYRTWRVLIGLAFVYVASVVIFSIAQHHSNLIVPIMDTTSGRAAPTSMRCISPYPCFYPVGYAIDTVIPIVNVHQADYWGPNGNVPWGYALVVFTWVGTGLGWLLATLAVAGYTGLVQNTNAL